jgi:hypothetical protein
MGLNLACTVDPSAWIELPSNEFEPQLTEFQDRISRASDWDTGARMVRKAALLINREIRNVCPIADGLFAYALDPEIEGDDSSVFVECGASQQQVQTWKQAGWI